MEQEEKQKKILSTRALAPCLKVVKKQEDTRGLDKGFDEKQKYQDREDLIYSHKIVTKEQHLLSRFLLKIVDDIIIIIIIVIIFSKKIDMNKRAGQC